MDSREIREKFLKFFEERGHTRVPSSSLVPENDSSVLFTTAGMQQFKPYYLGKKDAKKDFNSLNTVSSQKCLRTSDIEEVGDERHLTFFEMLGNFSFGGYWKKEAIQYAHEFVTKEMGLKIEYVTIFEGETGVPEDRESESIWKSIDPKIEIRKCGRADNFWGPTGVEGPCGPTTEIYVDGIEIWNIVFNEFYQSKDKTLKLLEVKGIDTGMGLERLAKVIQKVPTVFETDLFNSLIKTITDNTKSKDEIGKRIVADHIRSAVFMISDGVLPSNTERGYILRRLIRRARYYLDSIDLVDRSGGFLAMSFISEIVVGIYKNSGYNFDLKHIDEVISTEETTFHAHVEFGKKYLEKIIGSDKFVSGENAFLLYSTHGFPFELVLEIARFNNVKVDEVDFQKRKKEHQEVSKAGMEQKFKGGLAGHSDMEVKYHTATHLLHQALREVLGNDVYQKGSNITPERLRFDFSFPRKMTDEEKKKVEDLVNEKIKEALPVSYEDIPMEEAKKRGAIGLFEEKYGDKVRVYKVGDFSLEFCGGPHVENTSVLGNFKISKEEASSTGVRRIKAVLE